jgi:TATA-binding protein-associated factor Taf7
MVQEEAEVPPEGPEYRHGLTPAMRDARRRRFRREPDINVSFNQIFYHVLKLVLLQLFSTSRCQHRNASLVTTKTESNRSSLA